jgi:predicted LPLAT superfamily acyltransferase
MYSFAATILDRVFLLAGQFDRYDIRVHDGQIVLDQVATGRGCILLGSHLVSFEVLRALGVTLRRIPLKVLMDVDHNPDITRFVAALNREVADTIIPVRGAVTFLELKEKLDQGYVIGMLGDRVASDDKVVTCRFLGVDALFPTSAMLLAATAASPIILVFGLYRGGNRYDVHFERLTDGFAGDRLSRQDVVRSWTQHYAGRLEHYTRLAPYNWFNFYDFWGEDEAARG